MNIYYNGTDITEFVQVNKCIVRDGCGNRCDSLAIEFSNATVWYNWGPEEDDQIVVTHEGYDSGIMYMNSILPEDGKFTIMATALPCSARNKSNKSYINATIEDIMRDCAIASGMDYKIYGIDNNSTIPYIERNNESCAAFLQKLLALEGAVLKCIDGIYVAIGVDYAQSLDASQTFSIVADQEGFQYRRSGNAYRKVVVRSPYASAETTDYFIAEDKPTLTLDLPVMNNQQALRWARAKHIEHNRTCEFVTMENVFNPGFTSMARIDIDGETDAAGEWLIDNVEHDIVEMRSTIKLYRVMNTIE